MEVESPSAVEGDGPEQCGILSRAKKFITFLVSLSTTRIRHPLAANSLQTHIRFAASPEQSGDIETALGYIDGDLFRSQLVHLPEPHTLLLQPPCCFAEHINDNLRVGIGCHGRTILMQIASGTPESVVKIYGAPTQWTSSDLCLQTHATRAGLVVCLARLAFLEEFKGRLLGSSLFEELCDENSSFCR
jgi:hypothetical protein